MPGSRQSLLSRANWWAGSQCWPPVQPPCCSATPPTCQRCSSSTSNSRVRLKARRQLLRHRKPRRAAQEVTRTVAVQIASRLEWLTSLGLDAWVRTYYYLAQKDKSLSGAIKVVQASAHKCVNTSVWRTDWTELFQHTSLSSRRAWMEIASKDMFLYLRFLLHLHKQYQHNLLFSLFFGCVTCRLLSVIMC